MIAKQGNVSSSMTSLPQNHNLQRRSNSTLQT